MGVLDSQFDLHVIAELEKLRILIKVFKWQLIFFEPLIVRPPAFYELDAFLNVLLFLDVTQVLELSAMNQHQAIETLLNNALPLSYLSCLFE